MDKIELSRILSRTRKIGRVFMAYNCNIDNIVKVDKITKFARPPELKELENPEDIFSSIAYSMAHEESAELIMNERVEKWLTSNITPYKQRMGGQIGIMANHLASLGTQPIVYTPLLYKELCSMFSKGVILVDGTLKKPGQVKRSDRKKINWIFEYAAGQKFGKVTAKSVNRFIAASRPEEFRMKRFELDFDFSCSVLSGFHAFKEKYSDGTTYRDQFRLANDLVDRINERGKPSHIEVAYTSSRKIMKEVVRTASKVDSVGLDESELMLILNALGYRRLERKIHRDHDVRDILDGLDIMNRKMKTGKIHLHGFGYYMAVCDEGYHVSRDIVRNSMQFASVVAASVASGSSLAAGLKNQASLVGKKKEKTLSELNREDVIFCPASLTKDVRNIVGLGDIISSSIFAAEVAQHD